MQKLMLFFVGMLLGLTLNAQSGPVKEMDKTMSFGTRPAFRIEFKGANQDMVEDLWKKFAKERFSAKLKKDKKTDELYAENASASFSPNAFTLRSMVEKTSKEDAALNVWFDLGTSFLNRREHPQAANDAASALTDFYIIVRTAVINGELEDAEDKMKDLANDKRKLEKDNDGLHKDIENYKAKIKKAEDDIVKNEQSQNANVADQEAQRRVIDEIKVRLQNVNSERQ